MTPAAISLWLLMITPIPEQHHVPGNAWTYEATVTHYADAMLVPRDLAMDLLRVESTNGLHLEAWRKVTDPKHPKRKVRKLIAEGHFMVALEYREWHVKKAGMSLEDYDPKDVGDSARVGLAFMGTLLTLYHYDRRKSVAGYNAGPKAVRLWMEGYALSAETRRYLKEIFG